MNAVPGRGLPRAVDLILVFVASILALPVAVACAIAVLLDSGRPLIYRQRRIGRDGLEFELFKFRTMAPGSDPVGIGTAVEPGDPRVTRAGAALRRLSLDELPNLVNVLRGEMAVVGPRPTIPAQVSLYTPEQRRRLAVKPGLTGWAQVQGRAALSWEERIELDVWYVGHRSPWLDLRILARTAVALLSGRGLSPGEEGRRVPESWSEAAGSRRREAPPEQ